MSFFGCGLIDRTKTLDHGFKYEILDPIPEPEANIPDLATLCDQRATWLVEKARTEKRKIYLLWSGGIDSTAACVALLRALGSEKERLEVRFAGIDISDFYHNFLGQGGLHDDHLKILYSDASEHEYRLFYKNYVRYCSRKKIKRVSEAFDSNALIVTGEQW